eukprot:3766522-Rhodomonas_salina.2
MCRSLCGQTERRRAGRTHRERDEAERRASDAEAPRAERRHRLGERDFGQPKQRRVLVQPLDAHAVQRREVGDERTRVSARESDRGHVEDRPRVIVLGGWLLLSVFHSSGRSRRGRERLPLAPSCQRDNRVTLS